MRGRHNPQRRRFTTQLALGGLAAGLGLPRPVIAHPNGDHAHDPLPATNQIPGVLSIVGPWELTGLDPSRAGFMFSRMEIAETLFDAADDGSLLPGLAARWTQSADGREWLLQLRPQARFHDGSPVIAADVVHALNLARTKPGILGLVPIDRIDAHQDQVRIRLKHAFTALPAALAHSSTQILAPASYNPDGVVRGVIGSGPFRLTHLQPPQRFEVERFAGWDGPPPAIERATYLAVGRGETRALMAESGQADLVFGLDPASLQRLQRHPTLQVESVVIPRTIYLKLNAGHRWLADPRARQAISLALQRSGIAHAVLRERSLAASQLFPPTLDDWHVPALPPLHHDLAQARQLLRELGWHADAQGMLFRSDGAQTEVFSLNLRTFPDRPELPIVATAVQEQLRQLGIRVTVSLGNSSDIPAGHRDGSLELALGARNFAVAPDPLLTLMQDFGPSGGDWGAMGWHDPALDAALDALQRTQDVSARQHLRTQAAQILHQALPVIPVAWYRHSAALHPRVNSAGLDPLERSYRLSRMQWSR